MVQDGPRAPQDGPRWLQDGPKTAQDGPRWSQDGPKMASRRLKMGPRTAKTAQDGARRPQDGAKTAQDGPKMASRRPKTAPDGPKMVPTDALKETPCLARMVPKLLPLNSKIPQDSPSEAPVNPQDSARCFLSKCFLSNSFSLGEQVSAKRSPAVLPLCGLNKKQQRKRQGQGL